MHLSSNLPPIDVDGSEPNGEGIRIALYSHDTQGLGHIRRNLLIAAALARTGCNPTVLLISGLREAAAFASPPGVDCFTVPSLGKDAVGQYFSRSLNMSTQDLVRMREATIHTMLQSFKPDLLIVDKVPLGAFGELRPSLEMLRERGATCVLGLREILDEPQSVRDEWNQTGCDAAIRNFYSHIWVYGDQRVYDTPVEYGFAPDIAAKVRFTGYLNVRDNPQPASVSPAVMQMLDVINQTTDRVALCVVGGGRDGMPLARAFMQTDLPPKTMGVLVTGPLMPREDRLALENMARVDRRKHVLEFVTDPCPLLERCDRVIAMGGYNTVCEIMAYDKPALIVPRHKPRLEQLIRAERLAERGVLDMMSTDVLSPVTLGEWLRRESPQPSVRRVIDLNGVARLPQLMNEALGSRREEEVQGAA